MEPLNEEETKYLNSMVAFPVEPNHPFARELLNDVIESLTPIELDRLNF